MATYTGTGTQDDPYIVADWDSFVDLCSKYNRVYIKWAEVDDKLIDFNEINPDGFTSTFQIKNYVDFNNWTFRNMRFITDYAFTLGYSSGSSMYYATIKNLNIENILITGLGVFYLYTKNSYARNVSVTGSIVASQPNLQVYTARSRASSDCGILYGCSFVIDTPNPVRCLYYTRAQDSYIKINSSSNYSSDAVSTSSVYDTVSVINCLFKITAPNSQYLNIFHATDSGSKKTNITSCVFIIDTPKLSSNTTNLAINASIFNSDLAKDYTDVSNVPGLHPCTTEQMKDVEYLQSIGFPIGAV